MSKYAVWRWVVFWVSKTTLLIIETCPPSQQPKFSNSKRTDFDVLISTECSKQGHPIYYYFPEYKAEWGRHVNWSEWSNNSNQNLGLLGDYLLLSGWMLLPDPNLLQMVTIHSGQKYQESNYLKALDSEQKVVNSREELKFRKELPTWVESPLLLSWQKARVSRQLNSHTASKSFWPKEQEGREWAKNSPGKERRFQERESQIEGAQVLCINYPVAGPPLNHVCMLGAVCKQTNKR